MVFNFNSRGVFTTRSNINNQGCNQEFFRAGKVSWNKGHLTNISFATHIKKAPQGKMSKFFFLDPLKEIQFIDEHNQGISF